MSKKRKRSKNLEVLKNMPPAYHTLPGEEYDPFKSELIEWAIAQPDILNWLGGYLTSIGYTKYDPETGFHVGIDFEEKCRHGELWDECPDCRH